MPPLSVANWDKFQHADTFKKSDGTPPWIKLHQTILDKPEMEMLTDAELGFLVRIWLWAARLGNVLPDEYSWWRRRFNRDCTQSLARLIDLGLIEGGPLRKKPRKTRQTVANKPRPDKSRPEKTKNRTVGPSASTEDVGGEDVPVPVADEVAAKRAEHEAAARYAGMDTLGGTLEAFLDRFHEEAASG